MTLRVMELTKDSPANIAGFRVGDHIVKVTLLPVNFKTHLKFLPISKCCRALVFYFSFAAVALTLTAPITTKVVCFSRLLKCLRTSVANGVDPDQTAPVRAVCSGSTLLLLYLIRQQC